MGGTIRSSIGCATARAIALLFLVVVTTACASDAGKHALRGQDTDTVWNYSPRAPLAVPDHALFACCPRDGGDMRIDGVVDGRGKLQHILIHRPPAALGLLTGATCALFEAFVAVTVLDDEYSRRAEDQRMLEACAEGKSRFGGSYIPPAVPGTSVTCVERMATAWDLKDVAERPVSIEWKCPAPQR